MATAIGCISINNVYDAAAVPAVPAKKGKINNALLTALFNQGDG
jgi:hypothetical protein